MSWLSIVNFYMNGSRRTMIPLPLSILSLNPELKGQRLPGLVFGCDRGWRLVGITSKEMQAWGASHGVIYE
jgi:hypothetical protein